MEMDVDAFFKANEKFDTYNNRIGLPFTRSLEELTGESELDLERFDYKEIAKKLTSYKTISKEELFEVFGVFGDARNDGNFNNLKYRVTPHLIKLGFDFYKMPGQKGVFQIARSEEPNKADEPKISKKSAPVIAEKPKSIPQKNDYIMFENLKSMFIKEPAIISKINELFDIQGFELEFVITGIELRKKVVANEPND